MIQRINDFFVSQAIGAKNLSRFARFSRLALFLVILAIPTLLCGFLVSFKAAFQMWLLVLAGIIPMVIGFFLIGKHQWRNEKIAFLVTTGFIGFIFFEASLVGMLIDERSVNFSWQYILSTATLIGIGAFIFSSIVSLLFSTLFRTQK